MANIVNGGAIILVAAFFLAAIVGATNEFRATAGPASSHEPDPDGDPAGLAAEPSEGPGVGTPTLGKHGVGDDRGDKSGHGDRERDRDEDRHNDHEDDEDDG